MSIADKKDNLSKVYYLTIIFFLISFLGWLGETVCFIAMGYGFSDRGFLSLPFCTIYGSSILAIYLIIGPPAKGRLEPLFLRAKKLPSPLKILSYTGLYALYFVIVALIPTVAEFLTALFFDKLFGVVLWDYSLHKYNAFGYVCLGMSLFWGASITFAMSAIWPLLQKFVGRLSRRAAKIIAVALIIAVAIDFVFNLTYLCVKGKQFLLF